MPLLLENPSTYLEFAASTLTEAQFLGRGRGPNRLRPAAGREQRPRCLRQRGQDPLAFIDALPLHAVGEIHLAGFARDSDAAGAPC